MLCSFRRCIRTYVRMLCMYVCVCYTYVCWTYLRTYVCTYVQYVDGMYVFCVHTQEFMCTNTGTKCTYIYCKQCYLICTGVCVIYVCTYVRMYA